MAAENNNPLNPSNKILSDNNNNNNNNNHFLYKAIFVSIFLLVIPLLVPSQAATPDFINKTRSWEVVQLVLVGIAVSYGLFSSKRNDEPKPQEKEEAHEHGGSFINSNNTQLSYVTRFLQASSSVFDDHDDDDDGKLHVLENNSIDNNSKVVERTWNSQCYRGEPPRVVVAKESSFVDDATTTIEKLSLPPNVARRSIKPSLINKSFRSSRSFSSISRGTGRRRFSRNSSCPEEKESKEEEDENNNIVLRSPVPWRSRSGKMQLKEEEIQSPSSKTVSLEIQPKSFQEEDVIACIPQSSPIPPPPPPPPPLPHRQVILKNNSNKSRMNNTNSRYSPHKLDFQNRARQGGRVDVIPSTGKYHLSHDKEIESFIQRRGSQKDISFVDDEDESTQTQQQLSSSTGIKDSDESSSSREDADDDELQELASTKANNVNEEEMALEGMMSDHNNVDKKADEFIAKFREQIRLQRIASIRTSTTTLTKSNNGGPTTW